MRVCVYGRGRWHDKLPTSARVSLTHFDHGRVRQPETAGLVESLLQVFRLDKPLLLESLCASVAIVGALTCTAEGCQLLASRAEATAGMMSVLLQVGTSCCDFDASRKGNLHSVCIPALRSPRPAAEEL